MKLGFSLIFGVLLGAAGLVSSQPKAGQKSGFSEPNPAEQGPRTDPFGDPLPTGAIARLGTLRFRQINHIHVFSPDGKFIATSHGSEICLVDSQIGKEVRRGRGHENVVNCLDWSKDGKFIASGSRGPDKTIRLWDGATMKELRCCQWDTGKAPFTSWGVEQIIISLDGKSFFARGLDQTIRQFDAVTTREIRRFQGFQGRLGEIALAPDGKTLAALAYLKESGWGPCQVMVWDTATGKELRNWQFPDDIGPHAFSPDLKILVTRLRNYSKKEGLKIWEVATGKLVRRLPVFPSAIAFSPDGRILVAEIERKVFSFWKTSTGKEIRRVSHAPGGSFWNIGYCPDGKTLMSRGPWGPVRFWDAASGKETKRFEGHDSRIEAVAFSPDGKLLASVAGEEIRLWDIRGQKEIRRLAGQVSFTLGLAFSADARNLISVSANSALQVWDIAGGKEIRRMGAGFIKAAAFSPDREKVALWESNRLQLRDTRTLKILGQWDSSLDWNDTLAFSPDGTHLASGGAGLIPDPKGPGHQLVGPGGKNKDYAVHLLDLTTRRPSPPLGKHRDMVTWVTFSPDGRTLASVSGDNTIHLWEKATKQLRAKWTTGDNVATVCFSPNGKILASTNNGNYPGGHKSSPGEDWNQVRIWNVLTTKEIHRLAGHRGRVYSLSFSLTGDLLASGSDDATVLIWDMKPVYKKVQGKSGQLNPERFKDLWAGLSGADAARAYQALGELAAGSDQCLPFLKKHVQPVPFADPDQVARLAADLDSNKFATRQKAYQRLAKLGVSAKPALRKALQKKPNPSEELRRRVTSLLELPEPELSIAAMRAVEVLEHIASPKAQQFLRTLAAGVPDARLTKEAVSSLDRLNRRR